MRTAIVTGATSGIGLAITKRLNQEGIRVIGLGRDFVKSEYENDDFVKVQCDLLNVDEVVKRIRGIRKEEDISILINNAGVGYFGLHEELNPKKIHELSTVNLEIPMVLSQLLLRDLKKNKGHIINISSVTAKKVSPHGCAYGATKAALSAFGNSLFEENRKYGLKVTTIHPDMTKSDFYRNADFKEGEQEDTYIRPEEVAEIVVEILNMREGLNMGEVLITPQKHFIQKKILTDHR